MGPWGIHNNILIRAKLLLAIMNFSYENVPSDMELDECSEYT